MTQTQLGILMGKAQPWISQIENPDYGKWSVATLLDCAEAFDSDLEIKFRPFSRSLYELSHQDEQYFQVQSFSEELPELERAAISGWVAGSGRWTDLTRAAALLYPEYVSPQPKNNRLAQWAAPQPNPGVGFSAYQMPIGAKPSKNEVEDEELSDREKDKRRRAPKGALKGAAA